MHSCFRICWNEWFCDVYNQIVIGVMHEEHWYSCSETRLQWEPTTWAQSADHLALRMKVKVFWSISSTAEGKLQTKQPNRENNLISCNSDSLKIEKSGLVIFLVKLKLTKPLALPFDRHFFWFNSEIYCLQFFFDNLSPIHLVWQFLAFFPVTPLASKGNIKTQKGIQASPYSFWVKNFPSICFQEVKNR